MHYCIMQIIWPQPGNSKSLHNSQNKTKGKILGAIQWLDGIMVRAVGFGQEGRGSIPGLDMILKRT